MSSFVLVVGYRDVITVALNLGLGVAQEFFIPLAAVYYRSIGACSHPEFTSNRPPQVQIAGPSASLVRSAALTARSADYPYQMHQATGDVLSQILQADLDHAL